MSIILLYRLLLFSAAKLLTRIIFTRNIELISKTITIGDWYIQSSTYEAIKGQYLSYVIWLYKSNWIKNLHKLLFLSLLSVLRAYPMITYVVFSRHQKSCDAPSGNND